MLAMGPQQEGETAEPELSERDAQQLVMSLSALSSSMVARFYAQTCERHDIAESRL